MPRPEPLPPVARPAAFEPDVLASLDPVLSRLVWQLMNERPELRRLVSRVTAAPTAGLMNHLARADVSPKAARVMQSWGGRPDEAPLIAARELGLYGVFNRPDRSVWLRDRNVHRDKPAQPFPVAPGVTAGYDNLLSVLIHELTHAEGKGEKEARDAEIAQPPAHFRRHMDRALDRRPRP